MTPKLVSLPQAPIARFQFRITAKKIAVIGFLSCLAACTTPSKKPTEITVSIPNDDWWNRALSSPDDPTRNLASVRRRMAPVTQFKYAISISKMTEINAFAVNESGQTLVVFTTGFLTEFGNDPDILATTLGHELAHHQLGHTDKNRQENVAFAQGATSFVLGTVANFFIPFSGMLVSPAVKTATLTFNRDDEREADTLGMKWAMQAGYSPCGSYRFAKRMTELGKGSTVTFLSTHPVNNERMANADAFMKQNFKTSCSK